MTQSKIEGVAGTGEPGVPPTRLQHRLQAVVTELHILVKREWAGSTSPPSPWHGAMPVLERGISASHGANPVRRHAFSPGACAEALVIAPANVRRG